MNNKQKEQLIKQVGTLSFQSYDNQGNLDKIKKEVIELKAFLTLNNANWNHKRRFQFEYVRIS